MKKIVLFLCTALFLCGCSRSEPQDVPKPEQNKTPGHHYTGYYYAQRILSSGRRYETFNGEKMETL